MTTNRTAEDRNPKRVNPWRNKPGAAGFAGLAVGTALVLLAGCATGRWLSPSAYPVTPRTNVVEVIHGHVIADPYRWLEDDNSPATKAWVEAQNKVTFAYLERI
ncbi:MAG: hypothetical protein D6766_13880, partial [Verrucomicrobia bacterium]